MKKGEPEGKVIILSHLIWSVVREKHRKRHWGAEALSLTKHIKNLVNR